MSLKIKGNLSLAMNPFGFIFLTFPCALAKADRPLPHDLHMPTDYRYTDKHLRLVMTPRSNSTTVKVDTNRQTDGRMQPSALSPCFAVLCIR